jgi:molybdopterin-guanine dinucleotide biosynthesis protein A
LDITSIVLAGGRGLRLGRDKATETINGQSLIKRVVSSLSFLDSDIIIVSGSDKAALGLDGYPGLRAVNDAYPGKGPLVGIYSGLMASASEYNLVVACDMPFLNRELLAYLLKERADYDVVLPRLDNMVEPLHAVYSRACLPTIEEMFRQGKYGVHQLFELVKVCYVEADEIDRFDPGRMSFFNINTEANLAAARELAGRIDEPDCLSEVRREG